MIALLVDESVDGKLWNAIVQRLPNADIVRAQYVGLTGLSDPELLEWAAQQGRVIITSDVNTMIADAFHRVALKQHMPGLVVIRRSRSVEEIINEVELIHQCGHPEDWVDQVKYIPL